MGACMMIARRPHARGTPAQNALYTMSPCRITLLYEAIRYEVPQDKVSLGVFNNIRQYDLGAGGPRFKY